MKDSRAQKMKAMHQSRYLTVPAAIVALIPEGTTFAAELTEEGLLFRPVSVGQPKPPAQPPAWTRP